jgi:hypothetical protein
VAQAFGKQILAAGIVRRQRTAPNQLAGEIENFAHDANSRL